MYCLIEDEKYNDSYDKFSNSMQEEFDRKPIYSKKILKTQIKSYDDKAYFHDKKSLK